MPAFLPAEAHSQGTTVGRDSTCLLGYLAVSWRVMSKPKKNRGRLGRKNTEKLGLLPTIVLFLAGAGLCLLNCQVFGVPLCVSALGLGRRDLFLSHRFKWLTGRRQVAGYVILCAVLVPWAAYALLKPLFYKPNLIIKVNEITFVGNDGAQPTGTSQPGIVFAMSISNTGTQGAVVVGAALVPEGKTLSEGVPLTLTPDNLAIRVGDGPHRIKGTILADRLPDYRGLRATVFLKDGRDREYKSSPIVIQPGTSGEPTGN